jgi:hypothetical protein
MITCSGCKFAATSGEWVVTTNWAFGKQPLAACTMGPLPIRMHVSVNLVDQDQCVPVQRVGAVAVEVEKPLNHHRHPAQHRSRSLADCFQAELAFRGVDEYLAGVPVNPTAIDRRTGDGSLQQVPKRLRHGLEMVRRGNLVLAHP